MSAIHAAMRWVVLVVVTAGLTLAGGWALGAWDLPRMVMHVAGRLPVDDGAARAPRPPLEPREPRWTGPYGTEVCPGCRERRVVRREDGVLTILEEQPAQDTAWLIASVPAHEHDWHVTGCVVMADGAIALVAVSEISHLTTSIEDARWFTWLRALPDEQLTAALAATRDEDALTAVAAQLDDWDAAHQPPPLPPAASGPPR